MSKKTQSERLDDSRHGVPSEPGVSTGEMGLKLHRKEIELLEKINDKTSTPALSPSTLNTTSPDIHVNLGPQLHSLVEANGRLEDSVGHLGEIGEAALYQTTLHSHQLAQLDEHARDAFEQRNIILRVLALMIIEQEYTNEQLEVSNKLAGIANERLSHINTALSHGLNSIGVGISRLESQIAESREIIADSVRQSGEIIADSVRQSEQKISHRILQFTQIFTSAHLEQSEYLRKVIDLTENPVTVKSINLWQLGEKARKSDHQEHAKKLYGNSLEENPTYARNYYSLALIELDNQSYDSALSYLKFGIDYSSDEPELRALLLLLSAKVEKMKGNFSRAISFAERSFSIDQSNLETWYELSLVYTLLGNNVRAAYYLRNLLVVAKKSNQHYLSKILQTPEFSIFKEDINSIINSL